MKNSLVAEPSSATNALVAEPSSATNALVAEPSSATNALVAEPSSATNAGRTCRGAVMGLLRGYWLARIYKPSRHGELATSERRSLAERWASRHLEAELWRLEQGLAPSYVDRRLLRRMR